MKGGIAFKFVCLVTAFMNSSVAVAESKAEPSRPNIVIVMIDDMGYGDLSCHGSPHIETPCLDTLHASSVRLTDFHVAPMCSPTRGQLLTGVDAMRNGSTIVASSRMMVRADLPMMPAHFVAAGYATAQFGKWHLGENHPHRPQDRGFQETLCFPLQEISSLSDYWENDYFDPMLNHNGKHERFVGYCTDIFFDQAIQWMTVQQATKKPFLCYLPLNACHGPQWSPEPIRAKLRKEFPNLSPGQIGYLAMLVNADANVGRLETFLVDHGLRDNTIVVFLSDNGGYSLIGTYNAGMRDGKSRLAEGGHRVPCFIRWPNGGIGGSNKGRNVSGLTEVQDLLPTLLDLCGVAAIGESKFDGISLVPALREDVAVPDRTLIVQYGQPHPFQMTCVMRGRWRLLSDVKGLAKGEAELYDLDRDPMQRTNLIQSEATRAAELRAAYDAWWASVEPQTQNRAYITLGHDFANPVTLNSAEWRENAMGGVPGLREGRKRHDSWDVEVSQAGMYQIGLHRWPVESGLAIKAPAPAWRPRDTSVPDHAGFSSGKALPIDRAKLRIGDQLLDTIVTDSDKGAIFRLPLMTTGRTRLEAWFTDASDKPVCGAFFVTVSRLD